MAGSPSVRPRGRWRGVRRYDREAVSDQSQTPSVSEGESPPRPSQRGLARRGEPTQASPVRPRPEGRAHPGQPSASSSRRATPSSGEPTMIGSRIWSPSPTSRTGLAWVGSPLRARPHWAGLGGLSPPGEAALGRPGWALPLTNARGLALIAVGLAVAPTDSPPSTSRSYRQTPRHWPRAGTTALPIAMRGRLDRLRRRERPDVSPPWSARRSCDGPRSCFFS